MTKTKASLKFEVYQCIKEKIITCEYKPGSILTEAVLTEEMKNSRTPIREAIGLLEADGFVHVLPKKGIFVTDILLGDVIQIFQARLEIEPLCIKLGKDNYQKDELEKWKECFEKPTEGELSDKELDSNMHLFLIEKCKNKYIIDMMKKVTDQNRRIVNYSKENTEHIIEARKEHIEILDLLMDGQIDQAAKAMRTHIGHCRTAAINYFYTIAG